MFWRCCTNKEFNFADSCVLQVILMITEHLNGFLRRCATVFVVNLSYKRKFWLFYCKQVSACFLLKLGINCVFRSCRNQSLLLLGLMRLLTPINCNFVFSRVSRARSRSHVFTLNPYWLSFPFPFALIGR